MYATNIFYQKHLKFGQSPIATASTERLFSQQNVCAKNVYFTCLYFEWNFTRLETTLTPIDLIISLSFLVKRFSFDETKITRNKKQFNYFLQLFLNYFLYLY